MGFDAWDYRGLDVDDAEVATTTKTWAGWTKERFTKADNYVVQVEPSVGQPLRSSQPPSRSTWRWSRAPRPAARP